jgi:hypothetical protein
MLERVWLGLTGTGGLLRVRAALALGLTGIGGAYLLLNQELPPGEFLVLWTAATMFYFGARSNGSR